MCGCSAVKDPQALAQSALEEYGGSSVIETDATIQTASKEGFTDYQVHVEYTVGDEPTAEITLTAPESVKGITASYQGGTKSLTYDDVSLETLLPERKGITPADAVPAVLDCLCGAEADSVWLDGELLTLEYVETSDEGDVTRDISVDPTSGELRTARVSCGGKQTISCVFSGFSIKK